MALTNSQTVAKELKDAGLLLSKALIGDKWIGALDGRTVSVKYFSSLVAFISIEFNCFLMTVEAENCSDNCRETS